MPDRGRISAVQLHHLAERLADPHAGIQCAVRVLKHDLARGAHPAHGRRIQRVHRHAIHLHPSARQRNQAEQRTAQRGLPAPALAHQPHALAGLDAQVHPVEDGENVARPAEEVRNHIHGLSPFPGAWFALKGTRIKVLLGDVVEAKGAPGTFIDDRLAIACGTGAIRLLRLQREGKGAMDAEDFLRGFPIAAGTEVL